MDRVISGGKVRADRSAWGKNRSKMNRMGKDGIRQDRRR